MPLFRQSLSLVTALAARDSSNSEWQLGLGASHFWVGFIHWRRNDLDSALAQFAPYLAITKALVARAPDSVRFHNELGQANSNIGSVKESKGDLPGALAAFREAIRAQEEVVRRDSTKLDWQMDLANSYNAAGAVQRKLGDYAGAHASHRAELALKQRLVARDPPNQVYKTPPRDGATHSSRRWTLRSASIDEATREAQTVARSVRSARQRRYQQPGHGAASSGRRIASRDGRTRARAPRQRHSRIQREPRTPRPAARQDAEQCRLADRARQNADAVEQRAHRHGPRGRGSWPMHAAPLRSWSPWWRSGLPTRRPAA